MKLTINIEKKHFWTLFAILLVIFGTLITLAQVNTPIDTSRPWHFLQDIARSSTDMSSVDSDGDGLIDVSNNAKNAEKLGDLESNKFCRYSGWCGGDFNMAGSKRQFFVTAPDFCQQNPETSTGCWRDLDRSSFIGQQISYSCSSSFGLGSLVPERGTSDTLASGSIVDLMYFRDRSKVSLKVRADGGLAIRPVYEGGDPPTFFMCNLVRY